MIPDSMSYLHRAFFNTTQDIDAYVLNHDLKRALLDSKLSSGLLTVTFTQAAVGIVLLENDIEIRQELKKYLLELVPPVTQARPVRKSGTGPLESHMRAAFLPPTMTLSFHEGRLLIGPWQEAVVFDFDSKVGRREVLIHVMGGATDKKK